MSHEHRAIAAQSAYELATEAEYSKSLLEIDVSAEAADLMALGAKYDPTEISNVTQAWVTEGPDAEQAAEFQAALREGQYEIVGRIICEVSETYWAEMAEREVDRQMHDEREESAA